MSHDQSPTSPPLLGRTPEQQQRLIALAKNGAYGAHQSLVGTVYANGHLDGGGSAWGFETCPHPNCTLVREASLQAPASDSRPAATEAKRHSFNLWEPDAASRPVRTPDQPDQEQNDEAKSKDAEPTQATADASPLTPASQADQAALSPAREAWYRGQMEKLAAEVDMLRGVGCLKDGDGPCGVCIKCLRQRAEQAEAKIVAIVEKITGLLNHRTVSTEHIVRDRKEGTKHYGHNPSWIKMVEIVDIKESLT